MRPSKDCAPAGQTAGARGDTTAANTPKPTGGRPQYQGNLNGRNHDQRPPRWEAPEGWAAAELLEALWGPPRNRRNRA
jgi:hypothetical protein